MRKIWMLSLANIRKNKGHAVSMLMMFLIAALLLNAGLLVLFNFGGFFGSITKELNASDVYYIIPEKSYTAAVEGYFDGSEQILRLQKENSLWAKATVPYNGETRECTFLFRDSDRDRSLSKWKFVGEHLPADAASVYLPYVMKIDGGYEVGDQIKMDFKDQSLAFTVKGFTEDTFFSSLDTGVLGVYLSEEAFREVERTLGDNHRVRLLFANLEEKDKKVETNVREIIRQEQGEATTELTGTMLSLDLPLLRLSRTMMAGIISVMTVAFSAIITIVCLIVVRFRIGNSIEEDMVKIGSLKAVGYTSGQIVLSVVTQFSLIAIAGCAAGIACSYLTTPLLSEVFAHQSGLMWTQGFDPAISGVTLGVILLVVAAVSFISAGRIRRLHPITALRGGLSTHSFRRNHLPLERSKGSLPFVLALKSMLQNGRQSVMIGVILAAVSFAGAFAVIMFYNTTVDTGTFAKTPGIELANAMAVLNPAADNDGLVRSIKKLPEVRKTAFLDETMIRAEGNDIITYVMDDYEKKETNTIYEGRYPRHSNEVALAGRFAEILQKEIGDKITLELAGRRADFIITGLSQGANRGGMNASVRYDGMLRLNPDFRLQSLQIYLREGTDAAKFTKELEKTWGESLFKAVDLDRELELGMGIYTSIISKVGVVMLAVTGAVVVLVLYFMINSSVIRRKRELGIQKAIGFTTLQLMNQLSLGFLPPVIVGVSAGSIAGIALSNEIMSVAQRGMGIMKAEYIIPPLWVAAFGLAVALLSYATAMLITLRIRKISACALVSE